MIKKVLIIINILVLTIMIIHVAWNIYVHLQHPEFSAPVYVCFFTSLYYIVPLAVFDFIYLLVVHSRK